MNKMNKKNFALVIFLCLFYMSCAGHKPTFKETAYKTLSAAATSYEQTMLALGDYYKQGKISEETKDKIIEAANVYWSAYHSAVLAFEVYERSITMEGEQNKVKAKQQLDAALNDLNKALLNFLEMSNDYLSRLKKIEKE